MDFHQLALFVLTAAIVEISPGPNFVLIAKTVNHAGKRAAYANISGFAVAFCMHGALSIGGISYVISQSTGAFMLIKWAGGLYLCWIGLKAVLQAARTSVRPMMTVAARKPQANGFGEGLFTNLLNPKISVFYLAVFPQFVSSDHTSYIGSVSLVFIHVLINAAWFVGVIQVVDRFLLLHEGGSVSVDRFNMICGLVLLGIGLSFMGATLADTL